MTDGHTSSDYGWRDSEPTGAQAYLEPVVLAFLRRFVARRVLELGCVARGPTALIGLGLARSGVAWLARGRCRNQ